MQERHLLLGDEAIAQAALDAGISGAYAYPGTPSTEILEYVQGAPETASRGIHCAWSANEKTAVEEALGMSYAGRRAMVSMKHVGLNVAADPFVNSAITGANGGLLVVVADDPSMHSSQNEQDSRYYGRFAGIAVFEPSSQQQAYDMVHDAFDLSEQVRLPVLMRITTRLAHSRADIIRKPVRDQNPLMIPKDARQFVLLPVNARRNYTALIEKQKDLERLAAESAYNSLKAGSDSSLGIVTSGIAVNYLREKHGAELPFPHLHIGQYPIPEEQLNRLYDMCESVLVLEDGAPFVEEMIRSMWKGDRHIRGRLDGSLPRTGELSPDEVAAALEGRKHTSEPTHESVRARPPQLCKGCPHADTYLFLNEAIEAIEGARVFADIGCYTLGALPPYNAIDTCVDMGAAITMAKGAADAGLHPAISVIGDSTFTHSGMTGLLDCVYEKTHVTILILDNETTGMTGRQESMATGRLDGIVAGLGVDPAHLHVVMPHKKNHEENVRILREEIEYPGVSVIIARRSCVHKRRRM